MSLFDKFFKKNSNNKGKIISKNINDNLNTIKVILNDCDDIVYRYILVGKKQRFPLCLIYTDGLIDKSMLSQVVLEPLLIGAREVEPDPKSIRDNLYELVIKGNIAISEIKEADSVDDLINAILSGETVLFIDQYDKAVILSTRGWPTRSVEEPQTETVVRGPRDGFTETLKINISLIRRRIRDPQLKVKMIQLGERSKTDVAIMYIEDIVNDELLKEVLGRLNGIKVDAILDSSILEHFIEDDFYSPFAQASDTEKPDEVAASLYEGRIAIVVDNTPFVLVVPTTVGVLMQSSEDYYTRWTLAGAIRIIRYIAAFVALLAPSFYIAITAFHPGILPTKLALYVAGTRSTVPFPAFVEAFLMEITIEFIREAGTRISGPIGTTIGIVGGLVIGQAAVEAGIVSPLMVIIVAVTTISSFAIPSYEFASGIRFCRFALMICASIAGLYGIMLGLLILMIHLVNLESFGIPFTSPYSGFGLYRDLQDTIVRVPIKKMKKRPKFTEPKDDKRMS